MEDKKPSNTKDCFYIDRQLKILQDARDLVKKQAEDQGLWFHAQTTPEAYLQKALRDLHAVIELGLYYAK
jgi:hypothetical protein